MRDVVFVTAVVAFFAVALLYVKACASIAGDGDGESAELPQ
jgi:hypothetical protein